MSNLIPGYRKVPASQYDLQTYWGRVWHSASISDPRTLFVSKSGLEAAKNTIMAYKIGKIKDVNDEVWRAKKIVDSTLHPDTGQPVFLPFRMSCYVISNLVVTAGMLTPGLGVRGTLLWQITNQSLNVAINSANANKSSHTSLLETAQSYFLAVGASCSVALGLNSLVPRLKKLSPATKTVLTRLVPFVAVASAGALNVFLMRRDEIRQGIDIYPVSTALGSLSSAEEGMRESEVKSLGKSRKAGIIAVSETALSRVLNSSPIMVIPPLILYRLQNYSWLKNNPKYTLPVNLGLILTTSIFALPLALAVFPQRQTVDASNLEKEFLDEYGENRRVEFNRGI
ncbi:putative mitochondrial transport protein fsf1 [Golovinomyces cichoracearum]|uniref:Sidoreflexin n=1 Tax=Golovinomyces cichoracearum TaxID=62708 RepID=A0A420J547_9PEZI|nr:putative mitochondrial transport protein fsf1 [Golovinomyces cichoracearum]